MSKVYDSALQERLTRCLKSGVITQVDLAKRIGRTSSALSQYKNSRYDNGDVEALERDLREYFQRADERAEAAAQAIEYGRIRGYVPTHTSEDVYKTIRYCQIEKRLVLVYGDTGVGKTMAAMKFCEDNPAGTVYIEAAPSTSSLRGTLRAIADEMKLSTKMPIGDLSKAVRNKLADSEKTLIIDEAQNLSIPLLNEITRWTDPDRCTGEPRIAIVLIGNDGLWEKFDGEIDERRWQMRGRMLFRRICRTTAATMDDIRKLFPVLQERGMQKEMELLLAIARGKTGTRSAIMAYNNTVKSQDLSYDSLYNAARVNDAVFF